MENKTADYYLDATLRAKKPVSIYNAPGGTIIKTVAPDSIVGEIYSYVSRGTDLFWQLKEGGFVKHEKGKFDAQTADLTSSGTAIERYKTFEMPDFGKFLKGFTSSLGLNKIIVIAVLVVVVLFMVNKMLK